ncbi:MAG: helix-turn-helix transcriptional regulator [Clostridia bacterium]|nr:helix-turn-helix transcriptional regulator [Clostridia bacterium]
MITQKYIENSKELGENLKTARINSGLSQDVASKLINLNRSSLSYYENGRNIPTIFTIIRLMGIYKIDINDVILVDNRK